MSVGNIVAVNGLLLQLQQPFNFIGYTYQEIRQGFVDMHLMLELLQKRPEVARVTTTLSSCILLRLLLPLILLVIFVFLFVILQYSKALTHLREITLKASS